MTQIQPVRSKLEREKETLTRKLQQIHKKQEAKRASMKFECACGKKHMIKECVVIQTHWYTPPHGCIGGDYWNEGELKIICPITDVRNRVLFNTRSEIEWEDRSKWKNNPEMQFSSLYKHLFKEVKDDYNDDTVEWFNNFYFEDNLHKFGIHIGDKTVKSKK